MDPVELVLSCSPEFITKLDRLAEQLNESPSQVLAKALFLYEMAVDAVTQGDRLAILDADLDDVKVEIIGF